MSAKIHIGTQGWNYDGWVGPFYPPGTSKADMLRLYSKIFDTVEIDSTFYAIPTENSVRGWAEKTPQEFLFAVKLPSEITHKNRLVESKELLLEFCYRMRMLKEKLGCILIQMPPDFSPPERKSMSDFFEALPDDLRFAIEFRDSNWLTEKTFDQLRERNVALTLADSRWIHRTLSFRLVDNPTSDFVYVRWLGPRDLTDFSRIQIDRAKELGQWAEASKSSNNRSR
jgi:uncharacterized protein YecE (DUF72 family)